MPPECQPIQIRNSINLKKESRRLSQHSEKKRQGSRESSIGKKSNKIADRPRMSLPNNILPSVELDSSQEFPLEKPFG